ncbi:hypothetical protein F5Y18DRAFT_144930 [Xylariaceae sp. FL1019]|nr:hypothetical protein F5Y18DRAFT_144930 [Xylariaceae sp. FL1019]
MTDENASFHTPTASGRPLPKSSIPRPSASYRRNGSNDAESSPAATRTADAPIDGARFVRSGAESPRDTSPNLRLSGHREHGLSHELHPDRRRSRKSRPSSGFLLSNSVAKARSTPSPVSKEENRRRSRIPVDTRKGKSPLRYSEDTDRLGSSASGSSRESREMGGLYATNAPNGRNDMADDRSKSQAATSRRTSRIPSLGPTSAPLDVDATQIVSMALNLSESRRLASRRNVSSPVPPRLAQLPDSTAAGGSLKQHLQQQRRTSRTVSPQAARNMTPRIVSTPTMSSPMHSTFDHDGNYTYHFSSSTLDRAQKAKEYLELMAQYRRLLLFVPPLKQQPSSRPSTSGPTTSPGPNTSPLDVLASQTNRSLGRPYNPLQYIRNRKIRTRERRTIDGEEQGFADVPRVADWVDEVATVAATSNSTETLTLPSFSGAEESFGQQYPSSITRPASANKSKRLRFDWSIEPADMLADAYWLEQGDNKYLVEDRHYSKIFTFRPITKTPEPKSTLSSTLSKTTPEAEHSFPDQGSSQSSKADGDATRTRDRARQKLQDLKGLHHKHSSSLHSHHDYLRFRLGSSPDTSDSENDWRRRGRGATISASGQDLLEKQMRELLEKENREQTEKAANEADAGYFKPLPGGISTPETEAQMSLAGHRRKESLIETPEYPTKSTHTRPDQSSPVNSGRPSLEVPAHAYRSSVDLDSSRPGSPDVRSKGRHNGYIPTIGMDLSPNISRTSSPSRNPFSKVKSMFHERSREREEISQDDVDRITSRIELSNTSNMTSITEESIPKQERQRSKSATRDLMTRGTFESHKSHKSVGSLKLRSEEQLGLRTLFKGGAKLDGMIRGGVHKMTDLIWRKDSDASSDSSDDEVDQESRRGRAGMSDPVSPEGGFSPNEVPRGAKNYLDIMPSFKSTTEVSSQTTELSYPGRILAQPPSRSPRFDQLKPPRINIRKASPITTDNEQERSRGISDSESSEPEHWPRLPGQPLDGPRKSSKELQNILAIPPRTRSKLSGTEYQHLSIPTRDFTTRPINISRREVARLRTLMLCSGIKAMGISRRAYEPHPLFALENKATGLPWTDMSRFAPDEEVSLCVPQTEVFPTTARILSESINRSIQKFENSASEFSSKTVPAVQTKIDTLHDRLALDLMHMTHTATDEADEVGNDIADSQRLKVQTVTDAMDKMLRTRRRKFRWVRRAGWLALEWLLVGFMWYVWLVVVLARILIGGVRGLVGVVRWLLWL